MMKFKTKIPLLCAFVGCSLLLILMKPEGNSFTTNGDSVYPVNGLQLPQSNLERARKSIPMVIILTYQRCGSSFLGNLFDKNPDAFYLYEPLDSLYTAMYGTSEGWNVPSDITHYANGTLRNLPRREAKAVTEFQENLLTCQLDKLPVEFLTHKYWRIFRGFQTGLNDYRDCLVRRRISNKCLSSLKEECPHRFGDDLQKEHICGKSLWISETESNGNNASWDVPPSLKTYQACSADLHHKVTRFCIRDLTDFCETSSLRAIKTVRGTIRSIVPLLYKYPKLKIIHLVRDPRSVALSRMKLHSSRGIHSGDDFTIEARLYCETVMADYDVIGGLPARYSDRIKRVIYDDFVTNPVNYTENIYSFIDSNLPDLTRTFMMNNTRRHPKQFKMKDVKLQRINRVCAKFFETFSWKWENV